MACHCISVKDRAMSRSLLSILRHSLTAEACLCAEHTVCFIPVHTPMCNTIPGEMQTTYPQEELMTEWKKNTTKVQLGD